MKTRSLKAYYDLNDAAYPAPNHRSCHDCKKKKKDIAKLSKLNKSQKREIADLRKQRNLYKRMWRHQSRCAKNQVKEWRKLQKEQKLLRMGL